MAILLATYQSLAFGPPSQSAGGEANSPDQSAHRCQSTE